MNRNFSHCCVSRIGVWLACLVVPLAFACSHKPTTEPVEHKPAVSDIPIYFIESTYLTRVYGYYPGTDSLDTIVLPATGSYYLAVSPDGKHAYATNNGSKTYVLDLETRQVTAELGYGGIPAITPDGKTLILALHGIRFIDVATLQTAHFIDTLEVVTPVVDRSGTRLFVPAYTYDTGPLYEIDLTDTTYPVTVHPIDHLLTPGCLITRWLPSHDGTRWYFTYGRGEQWAFAVVDPQADSLLYNKWLRPNYGSNNMALTPNDGRVFFTHPGNSPDVDWPPPTEFFVYEATSGNCWTKKVTGVGYEIPIPPYVRDSMPVGNMIVTPDGKSLICTHAGIPNILTYDAHTLELVKSARMPSLGIHPGALACPGE